MTNMDDFNFEELEPSMEEGPPPEEAGNRTFLLVAGILGAILILSLILMAVYAMVIVPRRRDARSTQLAEVNARNTEVSRGLTQTAAAEAWTDTPTVTPTEPEPTATAEMTATPSPVVAFTNTPASMFGDGDEEVDPRTATVAALFTQQAENLLTMTPFATQLPDAGFADNVGIPALLALAGLLILIIFFTRRLRTTRYRQ